MMAKTEIKGKELSVKVQSSLSPRPPGDVGILLKELTPRRRLREEHVLLTIDFGDSARVHPRPGENKGQR
ncbi:hypothetical protein CEXT_430421 [Caerostris extrusa]|uniref:Uncharacterized protein n=1 Tax=Caerostris extrusa TaxID=172846 RepID=A0AAV4XML6_CAEEX|nr:hypothetical protein CEXT_430421 [Caerostris extrusa]